MSWKSRRRRSHQMLVQGVIIKPEPDISHHHRKPRAHGGDDSPENILVTTRNKHRAFHTLFAVMSPQQIARELAKWIDPDYVMVAVRRDEHALNQ